MISLLIDFRTWKRQIFKWKKAGKTLSLCKIFVTEDHFCKWPSRIVWLKNFYCFFDNIYAFVSCKPPCYNCTNITTALQSYKIKTRSQLALSIMIIGLLIFWMYSTNQLQVKCVWHFACSKKCIYTPITAANAYKYNVQVHDAFWFFFNKAKQVIWWCMQVTRPYNATSVSYFLNK